MSLAIALTAPTQQRLLLAASSAVIESQSQAAPESFMSQLDSSVGPAMTSEGGRGGGVEVHVV